MFFHMLVLAEHPLSCVCFSETVLRECALAFHTCDNFNKTFLHVFGPAKHHPPDFAKSLYICTSLSSGYLCCQCFLHNPTISLSSKGFSELVLPGMLGEQSTGAGWVGTCDFDQKAVNRLNSRPHFLKKHLKRKGKKQRDLQVSRVKYD